MRVEEGEAGLDGEHRAGAHLVVVLRAAGQPVHRGTGGDARERVPLGLGTQLGHHSAGGLAQRHHDHRDEDHDERGPSHPSCETLPSALRLVMTRRRRRPCYPLAPMRTGSGYVASLRDGRAVFLDGERVDDVTKHPAFVEPIRKIAETYDHAAAAPDVTMAVDPTTGKRIGAMWLIPRSADDLEVRRRVHRFWAEPSYGLMGRTPDHVACVLTAFASWRQLFDRAGRQFGDNVVKCWEKARDEDLYFSYAIVPPQIDRSQPAHRQPEPFLYPGVVRERDDGIVVRGCQAIATSAAMADWLFLSYITPPASSSTRAGRSPARPRASTTIRSRRASTSWTSPWSSTTSSCRGSRCLSTEGSIS